MGGQKTIARKEAGIQTNEGCRHWYEIKGRKCGKEPEPGTVYCKEHNVYHG